MAHGATQGLGDGHTSDEAASKTPNGACPANSPGSAIGFGSDPANGTYPANSPGSAIGFGSDPANGAYPANSPGSAIGFGSDPAGAAGKGHPFDPEVRLPNGNVFLRSLQLTAERLNSGSKIAITAAALRGLLYLVISRLPFNEEFYTQTYSDIAEAYSNGNITDLHRHFVEQGYFEGRMGTPPTIDEEFYLELYPDVAAAIADGGITSGADHYLRAGAIEGRFGNRAEMRLWEVWTNILNRT